MFLRSAVTQNYENLRKGEKYTNYLNLWIHAPISVEGLSAQDLVIVEEEQELHYSQNGGNDRSGMVNVVFDDEPDEQNRGDQEQDGSDHCVDLFQVVRGQREEVEDEQNDVDNNANKVQS